VRYAPYAELTGRPHVVVDGSAQAGAVLTLSHWPHSPTPPELRADTSAEIAFRYLDTPAAHVDVPLVTNNHFDQDGLVAVFALVDPAAARARRDRCVDVAAAGDFAHCRDRDSARLAAAIAAYADEAVSPLADALAGLGYAERVARLYQELLPRLPDLLDRPAATRDLWADDDALLDATERAFATGAATVEEVPDLDLAVVTVARDRLPKPVRRFTRIDREPLHPVAVHARTERMRVLTVQGRRCDLRFRYETWVQHVSRPLPPRVDLAPLAEELTATETDGGRWRFDGVEHLTPRLRRVDGADTTIDPAELRRRVEEHLRRAPPAWDPFAPS